MLRLRRLIISTYLKKSCCLRVEYTTQKQPFYADADTISMNSFHLSANPLLTPLKRSKESLGSMARDNHSIDDHEASATESQQDFLLHTPFRNVDTAESAFTPTEKLKTRPEVKFHPDTKSVSDVPLCSQVSKCSNTTPEMARCISIPNADLDEVYYSIEEDKDSPFGSIAVTVFYHEAAQRLDIEILSAQHLPEKDSMYNTYVCINLVPSIGNSRKQRTETEYSCNEPEWKESITYFGVSPDELLYKALIFSVMNEHVIGSDELIGQFRLPLRQLKSYELMHYHVYLEQKVSLFSDEAITGDERGKIFLSVRYNTVVSQLYVAVVRCAGLNIPNHDGLADPYVKLYLQPDYSKTSKRKTAVVKRTLNPEYHEEFSYKLEKSSLEKRCLEVTVWDHNMTRNVFLGGVCLSLTSNVMSERAHWRNVASQPDRRHDYWHILRDTINK